MFCKKGVFKMFAKFAGKHLCPSRFVNKVAALRLNAQVFLCEFCEVFKNTFSYRTPLVAASKITSSEHSSEQKQYKQKQPFAVVP